MSKRFASTYHKRRVDAVVQKMLMLIYLSWGHIASVNQLTINKYKGCFNVSFQHKDHAALHKRTILKPPNDVKSARNVLLTVWSFHLF